MQLDLEQVQHIFAGFNFTDAFIQAGGSCADTVNRFNPLPEAALALGYLRVQLGDGSFAPP